MSLGGFTVRVLVGGLVWSRELASKLKAVESTSNVDLMYVVLRA